ncbi:hypothetical protein B484DRAFT_449454 [Ochromonadaceae sp. CCMP2298]|nr:hypothetical protein B484DRAFT_449454 [Ochromonadaceae sp. CCMP2298]
MVGLWLDIASAALFLSLIWSGAGVQPADAPQLIDPVTGLENGAGTVQVPSSLAQLIIFEPSAWQVVYGTSFLVVSGINFGSGELELGPHTYICLVDVQQRDLQSSLCTRDTSFDAGHYLPGTHSLTFALVSLHSAEEESFLCGGYTLHSAVTLLVDTADPGSVGTYLVEENEVVWAMGGDQSLSRYDHTLTFNIPPVPTAPIAPFTPTVPSPLYRSLAPALDPPTRETIRVAFFAHHVAQTPSLSDRTFDWACDSTFRENGFETVIISGTAGESGIDGTAAGVATGAGAEEEVCGVRVVRFQCLSQGHEQQQGQEQRSCAELADYLAHIDAVVASNTYGDPGTTALLIAVAGRRRGSEGNGSGGGGGNASDGKGENGWGGEGSGMPPRRPLVVMDLPNLGLPPSWTHLVDAFVAPSRAVGLHRLTRQHGKPIAVIYPPLRDLVRDSSPCLHPPLPLPLHLYPHLHNRTPMTWPRSPPLFTFLFVGRLAPVKCPGLLLRAVGHILHPWAEAVEGVRVGEGVGEGVGDGEGEGARMETVGAGTAGIARAEASEGDGESGPLLSPQEQEEFRRNVKVKVVGGGVLQAGLEELAGKLEISDVVSFTGALGAVEVVGAMREADVLVNPILYGETFGFVHIEAAAQALPVIAFNVSANRESVLSGLLVEYRNGWAVADLAQAMVRIYRSGFYGSTVEGGFNVEGNVEGVEGLEGVQGMFIVGDMCAAVEPVFERWGRRRHSLALMDALQEWLG